MDSHITRNWKKTRKKIIDDYRNQLWEASAPEEDINAFGEEDKVELTRMIKSSATVDSVENPIQTEGKVVWYVTLKDKKSDKLKIQFDTTVAEGFYIVTESYLYNNDSALLMRQLMTYANSWVGSWNTRLAGY